ncbi:MAG TPA: glycosyl hydrolase family 2, partial [Ignavibacteriales bacterium]|nr:glycosyl hydrolase family 2 [Ignavibacteriales bacterium]
MRITTLLLLFTASVITYGQNYEMPAVFSDNMVLQRNTEAPFWGKALPGGKINVKASWGAEASAKAGADSLWMCKIKTPGAGGPYEVAISVNGKEIKYKNVLIGEVWICSGQSNMEMPLQGWPPNDTIQNSARDIAAANYPSIRFFDVENKISLKPDFNCVGSWHECSPATAPGFSATAFYFGRKLYEELKVPIGLISTNWGGTPVEAWTNAKYLEKS